MIALVGIACSRSPEFREGPAQEIKEEPTGPALNSGGGQVYDYRDRGRAESTERDNVTKQALSGQATHDTVWQSTDHDGSKRGY